MEFLGREAFQENVQSAVNNIDLQRVLPLLFQERFITLEQLQEFNRQASLSCGGAEETTRLFNLLLNQCSREDLMRMLNRVFNCPVFGSQLTRRGGNMRTASPSNSSRKNLLSFLCRLRCFALSGQRSELMLQVEEMEKKWALVKDSPEDRMEVADRYFAALEMKTACLCMDHNAAANSQDLRKKMMDVIPLTSDPAKTAMVQQVMEAWAKAMFEEGKTRQIVTQLNEQAARQNHLLGPCREKALLHRISFLLLAKVFEDDPTEEVKRAMMDAANNAEDCYLKEPDLQEKDRRQCLHLVLLPKVLVTLGLSHDGRPLAMPDGVQDVETAALLLEGVRRLGQTETLWCIMLEELGWSCLCRYRGNLQRALLHAQNALDYADRGGFQSEKGAIRAHLAGLFPTSTAESPESGLLSSTFAAKLEVRSEANEDDLSTPQCDSPACLLSVLGEVSNQVISDYSATSLKSWVDPTCSEAASAFPNYGVAMNDNGVLSHVGSETPMKETLTRVGPSRSVLGQESEDYLSSTVIKMTVEPSSNETMSSPHSILVHRHATHQQALAHAQSDGDYSSRQAVQAERGDSFAHYVMHPSPAPFPVPQTPRGGDLSSMFVAKLEIRSESNEENFSRPQYDSQVCMLSDLDGVRNQEARDCSATFPKSAVEPTSYEAGSTSPDSLRYDLLQEPEESDMSHTHRKLAYERVDSGGGSVRPTQDAFATATKCRERVFPMRNPRHPNRGGATPTTDVDDMRLNRAVLPSRCKDGPPGFAHQQANMCTESHRSSHRKYTRENAFCTRTDVQDHSLTQCKQAVGPGGDQSNDFSDDSITRCKEALPPPCCWHGNTTSPGASLPDDSCTRRKLPIQPLCCRSVSTEHSVQLTDGNTGSASAEFLRDWFDNVSLDSDHMIDYSCTEPKQSEDPSFHLEDTPRNYKDHQSSFSDDSVTRCEEGSRSWKSNSNYKSNQSSRRKEKKLSGFSIELPQSFDEF